MEDEIVTLHRKKRQKLLEKIELLLEWNLDLLDADITDFLDRLAETRDGVAAIEDVNQAYLVLDGITNVRKEKDQFLFWLSSLQDPQELQALRQVIESWKQDKLRLKITMDIVDSLQPHPVLPEFIPSVRIVDVTREKLAELMRDAVCHLDLRPLLEQEQFLENLEIQDEMKGMNVSEIQPSLSALGGDASWLNDILELWDLLADLLVKKKFTVNDALEGVGDRVKQILLLQLLGLLIDLGLLSHHDDGELRVTDTSRGERLKKLMEKSKQDWSIELFLDFLISIKNVDGKNSIEDSQSTSSSVPRSIIMCLGTE